MDTIDITFTSKEWKLMLAETRLYTDLVPTLAIESEGLVEIELSCEDWDELLGYIAAASNHTDNFRTEKALDKIYGKIDETLEMLGEDV